MDPTNETDGVIPTQGAQSATMDPMALVKAGLSYGRKQAGLPEQFYGGTPSFADGGVVPDPSGQSAMPDPQKAMSYISGDGAIAADIVDALENDADPDGTMDPSERTMAVFGKAGTPDGASGLLAHYRTRYNGYSGAARAALSQGDLAGAAHYATQAFASVPTGHSTRFAPAEGGLSMSTSKHGESDPSFSQGGTVDASNPDNMMGDETTDTSAEEDPSYAGGGPVTLDHDTPDDDTRYNTLPESGNIEDRRNQSNEGKVFKKRHDGKFDLDGEDYADRYVQSSIPSFGETGVIRKQRAFDDGGLVDNASVSDESDGSFGAPPPAVLQAQQVDALLSAGFDKTLEQALGVEDVGSNPSGPAQGRTYSNPLKGLGEGISNIWDKVKAGASKPLTDMGQPPAPVRDAGKGEGVIQEGIPEDDIGPVSATVTPQPAGASDYDEYAQSGEKLGQAPTTREKVAPKAASAKSGNSYTDAAAADPEMQKYNKYLRVANQMFPWMSQSREREAYIARRMHDEDTQSGKEKLVGMQTQGKVDLNTNNNEVKKEIATGNNQSRDARQERALLNKDQIANLQANVKLMSANQQGAIKMMGQKLMGVEGYSGTEEYKKEQARLAQETQRTPEQIRQMVLAASNPGQAPQQSAAPSKFPIGTVKTDPSGVTWIKKATGWERAG